MLRPLLPADEEVRLAEENLRAEQEQHRRVHTHRRPRFQALLVTLALWAAALGASISVGNSVATLLSGVAWGGTLLYLLRTTWAFQESCRQAGIRLALARSRCRVARARLERAREVEARMLFTPMERPSRHAHPGGRGAGAGGPG